MDDNTDTGAPPSADSHDDDDETTEEEKSKMPVDGLDSPVPKKKRSARVVEDKSSHFEVKKSKQCGDDDDDAKESGDNDIDNEYICVDESSDEMSTGSSQFLRIPKQQSGDDDNTQESDDESMEDVPDDEEEEEEDLPEDDDDEEEDLPEADDDDQSAGSRHISGKAKKFEDSSTSGGAPKESADSPADESVDSSLKKDVNNVSE